MEEEKEAMKISIDLDEVMSGDHWETTVGEIIRDEIKLVVRSEVRKFAKNSPELKKAIKALEKHAAKQITDSLKVGKR